MSDIKKLQPHKIASLIKNLHDLYIQLESYSRMGLTLFERGDIDAFNDNWDKRESVFSKIATLSQKLQPSFAEWESVSGAMTDEESSQCGEYFLNIRHLSDNTNGFDQKLRPLLENAKQDLRGTIQKLDNGKKLIRAYGGGGGQLKRKPPPGISRNG